jgi:hypothetical protein
MTIRSVWKTVTLIVSWADAALRANGVLNGAVPFMSVIVRCHELQYSSVTASAALSCKNSFFL